MTVLLIIGILGAVFVPAIIMFLVCGVDAKHKIGGALICLFFWAIMSGGIALDISIKADTWNNGYCNCGHHWELAGATKTRSGSTTKYYYCPNCYAEITQ